jgi:tRNA (cytidine/uridine-2'-O-)-methyltransferase
MKAANLTKNLPSLVLYQPDIPQNAGTMLRLAACLGVTIEVINPCGFIWDDKRMRRSGMDYLDKVDIKRHQSFDTFMAENRRVVLLSTKAEHPLYDFQFQPGDAIMVGRESAGVPDEVAARVQHKIRIPMMPGLRSINVALTAAMAISEALRQLDSFPEG